MIKKKNVIITLMVLSILIWTPFIIVAEKDVMQNEIYPESAVEAVEYHRGLTKFIMELRLTNYDYLKTVTRTRNARKQDRKRHELIKVVELNRNHVLNIDSFHKDSTLKNEFARFLELVNIVLTRDFKKIVDMEEIEARSIDQEEAHQMALDSAIEKMRINFNDFNSAEKAFFKKYNILADETKDELALKSDRVSRALEYYDSLNRIFYKVHKQDYYARGALNIKDIVSLEQFGMALLTIAEEGLNRLKGKKGYEGDDNLLSIAKTILEFYKHEGDVTYPANIDFHLKSDNFEKATKKIKAIKHDDRKQKDVDEYNKAVDSFNAAVKEINEINNRSFKENSKFIEMWNKEVDTFFEKHS
jgi:hypothetical protein